MQNGLAQLRRAICIDTAVVDFAFGTDNLCAAHRTAFRHVKSLVPARVIFVVDDLRDFGDHVAAALHLHPIANLDAQTLDLIHVVQCGVSDGRAADQNRRQHCDGRELASAPHLHADVFQLRDSGARGIFVSNRPARGFSGESEFILQRNAIDFDYDAINLIRQRIALCLPLPDELPCFVDAVDELAVLIDLEPGGIERIESFPVSIEISAPVLEQDIREDSPCGVPL